MIRLDQVTMRYGATLALDRASFSLERGEIVGLLGPNGAGKTTSMRILTTYLTPQVGRAEVAGIDVFADPIAVRRKVGYLPEVAPLYPDMQVADYLRFVWRAREVTDRSRIDWVVDACGLDGVYRKHVRELSRGYRQRVGLAQALIHDPEVLVLDEPTAGLDPFQVRVIRELIGRLAGEKTILLSTHVLGEAEAITDRAIVIHRGGIVADGRISELEARARDADRVRLEVDGEADSIRDELSGLEGVTDVSAEAAGEGRVACLVEGAAGSGLRDAVAALAAERRWTVRELRDERFTLEQTFIALTRGPEGGR